MEERRQHLNNLESKFDTLSSEVSELKTSIEGLLHMWQASRGLLSMIKWLSGIATCAAVIWAAFYKDV